MTIITIGNQKGGVGKTTIAMNVAREFTLRGHNTAVIESDHQRSAIGWDAKSGGKLFSMMGMDYPTIEKHAPKIDRNFEFTIIDGSPGFTEMTAPVIRCAHVVLIPLQPSDLDLESTQLFLEILHKWQEKAPIKIALVLSREKAKTNLAKEARIELGKLGVHLFEVGIGDRTIYAEVRKKGIGVVDAKGVKAAAAAAEIRSFTDELMRFING
jgi:chromosome partitioning protein